MKRKVFFSFHFEDDNWRVSQIRNIGVIQGNAPLTDNDWEKIKKSGAKAIKNWIDAQLKGKSCTVVLIGRNTAGRKWISYEIEKSWDEGKGILGIYIHKLKDKNGDRYFFKGENPFYYVEKKVKGKKIRLSEVVQVYQPSGINSITVYNDIKKNISKWIETAIKSREEYND